MWTLVLLGGGFTRKVQAADTRSSQTITASNVSVYVNNQASIKVSSKTSRTYTSRNTSVATVSSSGVVTGKKAGTTYITIKAKGTTKYKEASKTIRVTVKAEPHYVTFYNYCGTKVLKTMKVGTSNAVVLPSIANPYGYAFVGWAKSPQSFVSDSNPVNSWSSGTTITGITGNLKLYAVLSKTSEEKNIAASSLTKVNTSKYSRVIFVGDSRTEHMRMLISSLDGYDSSRVSFVARSGGGLDWLKSNGYYSLIKLLQQNTSDSKPVAVIFNLGVNDMAKLSSYVSYMKQISSTLEGMNCKLFYMSVNPYNCAQIEYINSLERYTNRLDSEVITFNRVLKAQLSGSYQFIDTFTYLTRTGMTMNSYSLTTNYDDGLHYGAKTYKRIFKYCMTYVNSH